MDNLLPGSAPELPRSFSTVTYGDDPNRADFLRQAQHFLHLLIVERAHKTCAQALLYHRKQDKHRDESPVDDAEETDSSLPISTRRAPYVRDDDDNQWSLGDEHLIKGGPRQIMFHSLITHHDELLWLCVPSRRIAGSQIQDPIYLLLRHLTLQKLSAHPPPLDHRLEVHKPSPPTYRDIQ